MNMADGGRQFSTQGFAGSRKMKTWRLPTAVAAFLLFATGAAYAVRQAPTDFNGDGYDDLAVGVPGEDLGSLVDAGAVQVFYGTPDGLGLLSQVWSLNSNGIQRGAVAGDKFGSATATGDFNADGYSDLAVGVPFRNGTQGQVLVLYGSATGLQSTGHQVWDQNELADSPEADDRLGSSLVSGDFDSDGFYDLAIGAPGEDYPDIGPPQNEVPICGTCPNAGVVNLIYGSPTGLDASRNELWHQDRGITYDGWVEWQDCFGSSLAVGDFNGNLTDDLAVGVACELTGGEGEAEVNNGAVSVYYGTSGVGLTGDGAVYLRQWSTNAAGFPQKDDAFGYAIAAGDYNDDGYDDLAIGVPGEETDVTGGPEAGALMVYYGKANGGVTPDDATRNEIWSRASVGLPASTSGGRWGWSLAAGDFNADGIDDVAVGSPMDDVSGVQDAGSVTLLFGTTRRLQPSGNALLHQDSEGVEDATEIGDWFGQVLQSGDYNGDTIRDLSVSAPFENLDGIKDAGAVHVINGMPGFGSGVAFDQLLRQGSGADSELAETGDQFGGRLEPRLYGNPWETAPLVDGGGGGGTTPSISGTVATSSSTVNLTTDGTADWVHWGRTTASSVDRKAGVTPQIGAYSAIGGTTPFASDSASSGYSWTDGTPTTSFSNDKRGLRISPVIGGGFRFTVPADTNLKTLKTYIGLNRVRGKLTATLSDNSAVPFTTYIDLPSSRASRVVTLDYRAASAGQTLTVEFTLDRTYPATFNWIMLEAATLQATTAIPTVATPTITPNGGSFTDPVQVTLATTTSAASIYLAGRTHRETFACATPANPSIPARHPRSNRKIATSGSRSDLQIAIASCAIGNDSYGEDPCSIGMTPARPAQIAINEKRSRSEDRSYRGSRSGSVTAA